MLARARRARAQARSKRTHQPVRRAPVRRSAVAGVRVDDVALAYARLSRSPQARPAVAATMPWRLESSGRSSLASRPKFRALVRIWPAGVATPYHSIPVLVRLGEMKVSVSRRKAAQGAA